MSPPSGDLPSRRGRADSGIRTLLEELVENTSARVGFLLDARGTARIAAGSPGEMDPVAFPSLAAAHFNAARQLASLLGGADFRSFAHQGDRTTVLLAELGEEWILAVVFDDVRPYEEAVRATEPAMIKLTTELEPGEGWDDPEESERVDQHWIRAAEGEIDRIFGGGE